MKLSRTLYDTVVIGGGIAGSTAAYHLAKLGYSPLIIEEKKGPHHKVCGEFLSPQVLPYLKDMGVDLISLGAREINQASLYSAHHSLSLSLPQPAYGISRYKLDEFLLQKACQQGAQLKRGYLVTQIEKLENSFLVKTEQEDFEARTLFMATGKHEIKTFHHRKVKNHNLLGLKMHYQLVPSIRKKLQNSVELYFFKSGYLGLSLVEEGVANLCLVVDASLDCVKEGFDSILHYIKKQNAFFENRLEGSQKCFNKPLAIAQIPYGYLKPDLTQKNVFFLGDQFGVIPSFSGSGMTLALISAQAAVASFHCPQNLSYPYKLVRMLNPAMRLASIIHRASLSPYLMDKLLWGLNYFPFLSRQIFEGTRMKPLLGVNQE